MSESAAKSECSERPRIGDRVKLVGGHHFAGRTGDYIADQPLLGRSVPIVRVEIGGVRVRTAVLEPETQMRKA